MVSAGATVDTKTGLPIDELIDTLANAAFDFVTGTAVDGLANVAFSTVTSITADALTDLDETELQCTTSVLLQRIPPCCRITAL